MWKRLENVLINKFPVDYMEGMNSLMHASWLNFMS